MTLVAMQLHQNACMDGISCCFKGHKAGFINAPKAKQ